MILLHVKDYVKSSTNLDIHESIVTVPAYFNQTERKVLLLIFKLAGIRVLQLMTYHAAGIIFYFVNLLTHQYLQFFYFTLFENILLNNYIFYVQK